MSDINVGDAIGSVVGGSAEIFSIGGTTSHQAQLCAGLAAHGVSIDNTPKGLGMDFAMANAKGYASSPARPSAPAQNFQLEM